MSQERPDQGREDLVMAAREPGPYQSTPPEQTSEFEMLYPPPAEEQCCTDSEREAELKDQIERLREDRERTVEKAIDSAYQRLRDRIDEPTTGWWCEFRRAAIEAARGDTDAG